MNGVNPSEVIIDGAAIPVTENVEKRKEQVDELIEKQVKEQKLKEDNPGMIPDVFMDGIMLDPSKPADMAILEFNRAMSIAFTLPGEFIKKLSRANVQAVERDYGAKLPELNASLSKAYEFVRSYLESIREVKDVKEANTISEVKDEHGKTK